jgi:succinate dehydrogenase / fumarate reductase, cytochrome b subunit
MAQEYDRPRPAPAPLGTTPAAQELKGAIDSGRTGDKVAFEDPAASPLGTDDEAAGTPDTADRVATAMRQELKNGLSNNASGLATAEDRRRAASAARPRPKSPNIQIYQPQLTSVLSILNRITGNILSACAVVLVIWLVAAATGPQAYSMVQGAIASWIGQIMLFGATFAFFLHLCGGIRHLVWDTVHGFELRSIYLSGWMVVVASVVLTLAAWVLSLLLRG